MPNRYTNLNGNDKISESYTQINDGFDHVQQDIDNHKASPTLDHPDSSVTTAKIAPKAVTQAKIADKAVGTGQLADTAVGTVQIAGKAVTQAKIADAAVGTGQIADGAVTAAKVAADVATQAELDAHVGNGDVHTSAAEKAKLAGIAAGAGTANSATDTVIGNRTATDNVTPSFVGTITSLFSSIFTLIKGITGKTSALTAPATTLEATKAHMDDSNIHTSAADKTKLAGIAAGAEVNQNAFSQINDIPAASKKDTLNVTGGTGITVTTNPTTKTVMVTATGTATPGAHASSHLTGGSDPIPKATTTKEGLMPASAMVDLEAIKAGQGRVDLTQTLGPGLSVVMADQNGSELDLSIQGRTLVNLLGSIGNFEVDSNGDGRADGWNVGYPAVYSLVTGAKYGVYEQRIASSASDTNADRRVSRTGISVPAGKYIVVVDCTTDGTNGKGSVSVYNGSTYVTGTAQSTNNGVRFVKFTLPAGTTDLALHLYNAANAGAAGWTQYDGAGLYAVDDALYARLGVDITEANIRDYFPHVDGKQHIQGVSVTKQGKNMLPDVSPASIVPAWTYIAPYQLSHTRTASGQSITLGERIPVRPSTTYSLKLQKTSGVMNSTRLYRSDGTYVLAHSDSGASEFTFTTQADTVSVSVLVYANSNATYEVSNWQLELGAATTSFTPAAPLSVILPITLGAVEDVKDAVYSDGNDWMYVEKVQKDTLLDGSLNWVFALDYTGYKRLTTQSVTVSPQMRVTRYDYLVLNNLMDRDSGAANQAIYYSSNKALGLTIADSDSGWTETLNPNANAIKALMNGWKAKANNGTAYTSWASILDGSAPATNTEAWVSANKAPGWTAWATLDYAQEKPVISKVSKAEGAITLHPGGNQIGVETGIIQREKVVPKLDSGRYYIISSTDVYWGSARLSRFASKILTVYKNGEPDPIWAPINNPGTVAVLAKDFDSSAEYTVTYVAQDKYNMTAGITEAVASWRTGLSGVVSDVVQSVAELRQADDQLSFADDYIEAKVDNLRRDFDQSSAHLGTLGGASPNFTGSATPPIKSLTPGLRLSFKMPINTTGPITLNVNGLGAKAIKKPNGNNPILTKDGVYTVVYEGSAAFILQGEGGEYGTATAADVKAGKSIGTEDGVVQGTMPDRGAVTITPGQSAQSIPAGYHNGSGTVPAVGFDAAKVLTGTTIAGKAGTMPNRSGVSTDNIGVSAGGDGNLWLNTPEGYYNSTASIHAYDPNFVAGSILSDRTIFGLRGEIPIINEIDPAEGVGKWGDGALAVYPRRGYRKGGLGAGEIKVSVAQLQSVEGNLRSNNIRKGVSVFGVLGELEEGKKYASGSVMGDGNYITVNGLSFTPRMVRAQHQQDNGYSYLSMFTVNLFVYCSRNDTTGIASYENPGDGSVYNGGFKLISGNDDLWTWEAWA